MLERKACPVCKAPGDAAQDIQKITAPSIGGVASGELDATLRSTLKEVERSQRANADANSRRLRSAELGAGVREATSQLLALGGYRTNPTAFLLPLSQLRLPPPIAMTRYFGRALLLYPNTLRILHPEGVALQPPTTLPEYEWTGIVPLETQKGVCVWGRGGRLCFLRENRFVLSVVCEAETEYEGLVSAVPAPGGGGSAVVLLQSEKEAVVATFSLKGEVSVVKTDPPSITPTERYSMQHLNINGRHGVVVSCARGVAMRRGDSGEWKWIVEVPCTEVVRAGGKLPEVRWAEDSKDLLVCYPIDSGVGIPVTGVAVWKTHSMQATPQRGVIEEPFEELGLVALGVALPAAEGQGSGGVRSPLHLLHTTTTNPAVLFVRDLAMPHFVRHLSECATPITSLLAGPLHITVLTEAGQLSWFAVQ